MGFIVAKGKKKINFVKYFMRNAGHGNGLIVKGGVRLGKSTLISFIIKLLLDNTDFCIISNIKFHANVYEKYKDRIFYINSLEMYLDYYSKIPYSKPILLAWDDAQASEGMTSKDVMGKSGKKLAQFLIFIGKMQTSYIYVAHQSYIPRSITEGFNPMYIYKTNRHEFVLSADFYENDKEAYYDTNNYIIPLPKPELEYLENGNTKIADTDNNYLPIMSIAFTSFNFDSVDLDELFNMLSHESVGENVKETVKVYLNQMDKSEKIDEWEYLKKLSYEKIYMALCLKHNEQLSDGKLLREVINPNMINSGRKKLTDKGIKKGF